MTQWGVTHSYDIPIKLNIVDHVIEFMLKDMIALVGDVGRIPRMWVCYINNGEADVQRNQVGDLIAELDRVRRHFEVIRIENLRYDDICDILD